MPTRPWLIKEIVVSNLKVAWLILQPKPRLHSHLIEVPTAQQSDLGRAMYANSITLTPGTVTVRIDDDKVLVHCLDDDAAEGLRSGEMDRRVRWVDRGSR